MFFKKTADSRIVFFIFLMYNSIIKKYRNEDYHEKNT